MSMVGRTLNRFVTWLISPEFDRDINQVQIMVVRSCRFLPTIATVGAMLSNPAIVGVAGVAAAICSAVSYSKNYNSLMSSLANGSDELKPEVDGVIIEGEFI